MLYRKYRPRTFSEVVGQEHVVKTLLGALESGRVGHAYLFCGPRGTGKTTLARLLAKALNCGDFQVNSKPAPKPCNKCDSCSAINENRSLDLVEIDAASQTGVDHIRELTDSANVAAPSGGYKIFLVDEAHMLSKSAFNALLKTLEEPPEHVVFILATTEPHKILPTVLSRVQRFDFKRLMPKEIFSKLKQVAQAEKISIAEDGLTAIAISSDGALRDAEVSLAKVIASCDGKKTISIDDVYSSLGLIPLNYHPEFLGFLIRGERDMALGFVNKIYSGGISLDNFISGFIEYLRKILIHTLNPAVLASVGEELMDLDISLIAANPGVLMKDQLIRFLNVFAAAKENMKSSQIPQLPLELAVLELLK